MWSVDCLAVKFAALTERLQSKVFEMYDYSIMLSVRTSTACGGEQSVTLICIMGEKEFHVVRNTTTQYIECENAAKQLQDGSDYLTNSKIKVMILL